MGVRPGVHNGRRDHRGERVEELEREQRGRMPAAGSPSISTELAVAATARGDRLPRLPRRQICSGVARLLCLLLALVITPQALASGGHYTFSGGTPYERAQVRQALRVSAFNWSLVEPVVTVRIAPGLASVSIPGRISLDARLLDAGEFSWGVVQHEYAHQVDYFVFDDEARALFAARLGGQTWYHDVVGLPHGAYGCERFASTLAWAYWPSARNSMRPTSRGDESAAMTPARFRALLDSVLARPPST
jgi:hypothetical protein